MPSILNDNITLEGHVDDFYLDGFEVDSLNYLYDRLSRNNLTHDGDARIGGKQVHHYTYRDKAKNRTCSMFYTYGNQPSHLYVYAIGKHTGDNNKDYKLYTYVDKKQKRYTFNPSHKDDRYRRMDLNS